MGRTLTYVTVIPVKALAEGKSRLAGILAPAERERLCSWMFQRTLGLIGETDEVLVISGDPDVEALCRDRGPATRFVLTPPPASLNGALRKASEMVAGSGRGMLVLPIDLVKLDVETLRGFVGDGEHLVIAGDAAGFGTNLLHVPSRAVGLYRFAYGEMSFGRHIAEAGRLGLVPRVDRSPLIALDLDTPDDLARSGVSLPA